MKYNTRNLFEPIGNYFSLLICKELFIAYIFVYLPVEA